MEYLSRDEYIGAHSQEEVEVNKDDGTTPSQDQVQSRKDHSPTPESPLDSTPSYSSSSSQSSPSSSYHHMEVWDPIPNYMYFLAGLPPVYHEQPTHSTDDEEASVEK